jgi:hypothetical protein
MDGGDPQFFCGPWRQVIDDCAIEGDRAGVWLEHPGHEIDQGALAGTVLTDETVDLSSADLEVNVSQDDVSGECLCELDGLQHRPVAGVIDMAGTGLFLN